MSSATYGCSAEQLLTGALPLAEVTLKTATTERCCSPSPTVRLGLAHARCREGYEHGLATLARDFGVDIID